VQICVKILARDVAESVTRVNIFVHNVKDSRNVLTFMHTVIQSEHASVLLRFVRGSVKLCFVNTSLKSQVTFHKALGKFCRERKC